MDPRVLADTRQATLQERSGDRRTADIAGAENEDVYGRSVPAGPPVLALTTGSRRYI